MSSSMIDWRFATSVGARIAGPGPEMSRAQADEVVAELRAGAARSTPLVQEFTGLISAPNTAPVLVVDRANWVAANADSFAQALAPIIDKMEARTDGASPLTQAIGSRVTGLEVGGMLGFLASKVLGQFDPFSGTGRLLLVAPNIVSAENELDAVRSDFRLWVCLHEETHRVQFTAVPWMREHLLSLMENLVSSVEVDPSKMAAAMGDVVRRAGDLVRGGGNEYGLMELFATPEQREILDRATAVMSLLEGHADVVMDGVGPEVIPSVADIRKRFDQRRKGVGIVDRVLRRLMGLDAKMAQYRNGAGFVNGVVSLEGMAGFNQVWADPAHLPTRSEISAPRTWVDRVLG